MSEDAPPEVDESPSVRDLVVRLSRPHPSGGRVVERASLLAAGADFARVLAWIEEHGGQPEFASAPARESSVYHLRGTEPVTGNEGKTPQRFILPAEAVAADDQ